MLTVEQGVRVLACIGNQQGLRALLAFSGLHDNIRRGLPAASAAADQNLETKRFVLHEILQLICARVLALTQADSVLIALAEGGELVCRAAAGSHPVSPGTRLNLESAFLQAVLESGKTIRCEDADADLRLQSDFARQLDARSTVLVPLHGHREHLGVLQAFSSAPWSFPDHDVRCLDLFAELVLAALKPADQDRRLHWLGDVAGELLQSKQPAGEPNHAVPTAAVPTAPIPAVEPTALEVVHTSPAQSLPELPIASLLAESASSESDAGTTARTAPGTTDDNRIPLSSATTAPEATSASHLDGVPEHLPAAVAKSENNEPGGSTLALSSSAPREIAAEQATTSGVLASHEAATPSGCQDLGRLSEPVMIPVEFEFSEPEEDEVDLPTYLTFERKGNGPEPALAAPEELGSNAIPPHSFLSPLTSRPGLSVVLVLVLVAGLFSAGVWWGMQAHSPAAISATPKATTAPPVPETLALSFGSDDPMAAPPSDGAQPAPVPEEKLAALPKITGVRHWSSSLGSSVVIDMEDQVNYEVHRLMSPERIYFDLHDTALPSDLDGKTIEVGEPSLTSVRVAQPVAGMTRVVLDTRGGSNFSVSMETNPYRLVVELHESKLSSSSRLPLAPKAVPAAPLTASANSSSRPIPARTGKFRIVLDAGHGGWDLGTVGQAGLLEKDLVLDVTRRLGRLLQSRNGADVMFTRSGDDYVALDQRADFANQAQADLFVSVHANYSNRATARGVETYYTNFFSAPGLKEIEKHTDGTFTQPAPVTLSADGLHEKIEESRRLAASVQRSLYATLAAKSPDIRDRGIKDASFVVLTGTTMPAILTEISFVSSPADERNLQSEAYRQEIAEALYKGITHYEDSFPRQKVAQLRSAAAAR